ncbi:MAG: DUF91 domain-containing protein [Methylobacterium mesophilicum]|nr:DUF91 domain-containing protein [Methylobacterium mesophilicum]
MTYRVEEFREYFRFKVGAAQSTHHTYNSYLNRIDQALGGLDEALVARGSDAVWEWGRNTTEPPFDTYPSNARSSLKRYLTFLIEKDAPPEPDEFTELAEVPELAGSFFKLEREMQAAVRQQLGQIEAGLVAADNGSELATATGRVDIVARDANNILVAIELKAGECPPGALEQVLGYAQALSEERGERVRAILVASSFSDRMRAAAKRAADTQLFSYEFSLKFGEQKQ